MSRFQFITAADSYRADSQDRVEIVQTGQGIVVIAADGVGGSSGGAEAADMLVSIAREAAHAMPDIADGHAWAQVLMNADRRLHDDPHAGETTAVVLGITSLGIGGASAGDSIAWLISEKQMQDLTADQRKKPFVGTSVAIPLPFFSGQLEGTLLAATDGLWKYTSPETICSVIRNGDFATMPRELIELVRSPVSRNLDDDVAIALVRRI